MLPEKNLTAAEIRRKINKPIMEKKRRQRINKCLEELKEIVVAQSTETTRTNKLEKADILEMTVLYLRGLHGEGIISRKKDLPLKVALSEMKEATAARKCLLQTSNETATRHVNVIAKQKGYAQCAQDTILYLQSIGEISSAIQNQVFQHLNQKCKAILNKKQSYNSCDNEKPDQFLNHSIEIGRPNSDISVHSNSCFRFSSFSDFTPFELQGDGLIFNKELRSDFDCKDLGKSQAITKAKKLKKNSEGEMCHCKNNANKNLFGQASSLGINLVRPTAQCKSYVNPLQDSLRSERLCSSNDSGNWSSGSRSTTPNEIYYEEPAICFRLPSENKSELPQAIKNTLWRPWET